MDGMIAAAVRDISEIWLIRDDRPDKAEFATTLVPDMSVGAAATDALIRDELIEDSSEASCGEVDEACVGGKGKVPPTVSDAETVTGAVTVGPSGPELEAVELV